MAKIRSHQITLPEIGLGQIGLSQMSLDKAGALEVRPAQYRPL
jgi:hypothetical protein